MPVQSNLALQVAIPATEMHEILIALLSHLGPFREYLLTIP